MSEPDWSPRLVEMYGPEISTERACDLIVAHGIGGVEKHPAVDEIRLGDGSTLRHWHGSDDHDCVWSLEPR